MLRPLRTILLLIAAFVAGVFSERAARHDQCLDRGGAISEGLCIGVEE
jgi:hypothetical protein